METEKNKIEIMHEIRRKKSKKTSEIFIVEILIQKINIHVEERTSVG